MYSLDFVHELTSVAGFTSLDVNVWAPSDTTPTEYKYAGFVVGDISTDYQLDRSFCNFKHTFDDAFSIRRNGVWMYFKHLMNSYMLRC